MVALVAAGAVAYAVQDRSDSAEAGLPVGDFPEPGVVHVHGLGVDPGDGTLYAATHSGLFRLPASGKPAQRVAMRLTAGSTAMTPRRAP